MKRHLLPLVILLIFASGSLADTCNATEELHPSDVVEMVHEAPFATECLIDSMPEERDRYIGLFLDDDACQNRVPKSRRLYISSAPFRYYAKEALDQPVYPGVLAPDKMYFLKSPISLSYEGKGTVHKNDTIGDMITYVGFGCTDDEGNGILTDMVSEDGFTCYALYALKNKIFSISAAVNTDIFRALNIRDVPSSDTANMEISLGLSKKDRKEVLPLIPAPLQGAALAMIDDVSYFYLTRFNIHTSSITIETMVLEKQLEYLNKTPIPLKRLTVKLDSGNMMVTRQIIRANNLKLRKHIASTISHREYDAWEGMPNSLKNMYEFWPQGSDEIDPREFFCDHGWLCNPLLLNETITRQNKMVAIAPGAYSALSKCNLSGMKGEDADGNVLWKHEPRKDYCFYIWIDTYLSEDVLDEVQRAFSEGKHSDVCRNVNNELGRMHEAFMSSSDERVKRYRDWLIWKHDGMGLFSVFRGNADGISIKCEYMPLRSQTHQEVELTKDLQDSGHPGYDADESGFLLPGEGGGLGPQRELLNRERINDRHGITNSITIEDDANAETSIMGGRDAR